MIEKNKVIEMGKEIIKGAIAFVCAGIGIMGSYPALPAYFAVCSMEGRASFWVIVGALGGILYFMNLEAIMKYLFMLLVIAVGLRLYIGINRFCSNWWAAIFTGIAVVIMHYAGNTFRLNDGQVLIMGLLEGAMSFGLTVCIHYLFGLVSCLEFSLDIGGKEEARRVIPQKGSQSLRMESFAYAVNGLSDAFFAMSQPKEKLATEEVSLLEQELTGKLCASCDGCAICWNENRMRSLGGIRALLHAVINHSTREELLMDPYVENCQRYEGMVEEALQAFGRLELNYAWYNRLRENRYVIAQQLDAMAGLMEEWAKARVNIDEKSKILFPQILYQVKEKGLLVDDLHIYEENKKLCVEGYVYSKWNGGIPVKHYLSAVEKALHKPMRMGKEGKTILTQEPVFITLYEDTQFYGLQGIATEKKTGSFISGDSFSFFAMDDGNYHICLSDGMGSGARANQESEMVVDLLQKFIEAGFRKEIAIKLMNSAMVLQGEENSFSTLDYAMIDLYTGQLELIKIGGAATFIKRGEEVEIICDATLPAGADVHMKIESVKKQLGSGDFLVMVTDGVIEYLHVRNPKEVLADIIGVVKTDNAGVLAETVLEQVLIRTGGQAMDDMTVLVTGIWEK